MADDRKTPRKWSLEEIDELLQDSGMLSGDEDALEFAESITEAPKAVAFNPRPSHNENIEHRIITETVERSDSVAEPQVYGAFVSEKYRERFFNKPVQNIEKTAEHELVPEEEQKYERGGFVRKKSNFAHTADLSPVPNLVPDDKVYQETATNKTIVFDDNVHTKTIALRSLAVTDGDAHDIELPVEAENLQLTFEGFHNDDVEIVDESEIENELLRKRKEKVSTFTVTGEVSEPEKEEKGRKYGTDEYRTVDDKFKVAYYLRKKRSVAMVGSAVSYVCCLLLAIISVAAKNIPDAGAFFVILSVIFTLLACIVNYSTVFDGIKSFKGFKFNRNSGCFLAIAVTLIQQIVFLVSGASFEKGIGLFSAVAVLSLAFNVTGEYIEAKRISENFSYLTDMKEVYSAEPVLKEETAFEIGRGLLLEEPCIFTSRKTLFPRRFMELSEKYYPSDDISQKLVPISFSASMLIGAVSYIVTKDILSALTAFCAGVSISTPYFAFIADSIAMTRISKKLRKKGGMIAGWEALRECEKADAVAVDSADIFDEDGGNVYGIHPFYDIQIDEAIIYTAALVISSGGPLGNLFKRIIVGEVSLLPPVDSLAYEDKLGLSAWIFNRRVLVGNSNLLINHNVEIPDNALIKKHLTSGRYPLYLAIDGKAAAVFIVSYDVNEGNASLLKKIESNNISLLVRSDDANIKDDMVAEKLELPSSGVKVLSAVSGDIYRSYVAETSTAADALLIHDGRAYSFLYAIKSALSLSSFKQVLSTFVICATGIGIAIVSALALVSGIEHLNCIQLMVTQLFFTGACVFTFSSGHAIRNRERKAKRGANKKKSHRSSAS